MKTGMLLGSLVVFVVGFLFSMSPVGIIIGLPLMIISIVILAIGVILPENTKKKSRKK